MALRLIVLYKTWEQMCMNKRSYRNILLVTLPLLSANIFAADLNKVDSKGFQLAFVSLPKTTAMEEDAPAPRKIPKAEPAPAAKPPQVPAPKRVDAPAPKPVQVPVVKPQPEPIEIKPAPITAPVVKPVPLPEAKPVQAVEVVPVQAPAKVEAVQAPEKKEAYEWVPPSRQ
jgi:hypothetical protein